MDKYISFNLYRSGWTTQGAAVAIALDPDGERREVYLAADVHELLERCAVQMESADTECRNLAAEKLCAEIRSLMGG